MLTPAFAKKAREAAQVHAQVSVVAISTPAGYAGGECRLRAVVERVFRGAHRLPVASSVEFSAYCYVPPDRAPTGPEWLDFGRLKEGSLLEAFFDQHDDDGRFGVAMFQIAFIDSLTLEPQSNLWYQGASDHPHAATGFLRSLWRRLWPID
jgi:hypothetical protein